MGTSPLGDVLSIGLRTTADDPAADPAADPVCTGRYAAHLNA